MEFSTPRSLSYQPLVSRRRSSLGSVPSSDPSAPSSPVDAQAPTAASGIPFVLEPAVKYVYTCERCGFGTNLLSSYMPHASNPCDQPPGTTWGKL
ncbi:hypothetical protein GGF46_004092 [Coemansia sp. RSA 552]|nr:hypothetical protein GGF46_004092 [Coemansia sp. RSA 552]